MTIFSHAAMVTTQENRLETASISFSSAPVPDNNGGGAEPGSEPGANRYRMPG